MTPVRERNCPWRWRVLVLCGVVLGVLMTGYGTWAAPSQLPMRQTVPTRTPTKRPTATPTQTLVPTASPTLAPTEVVSPEPTTRPTEAAPNAPTALPDPAASLTPISAGEDVGLPPAGVDWGAQLLRSLGIALGGLLAALVLGALTFARRAPTDDRAG